MQATPPPVMDQKQTCELLGIGRSLFFQLVRRGELPGAFKVGRLVRVHTATLLSGLAEKAAADAESTAASQGTRW
jgi:excisionase family DNA binding protein